MFELRFLRKKIEYKAEVHPGTIGGPMMDAVKYVKVLQYRTGGMHPCKIDKEWSEWANVPCVDESAA